MQESSERFFPSDKAGQVLIVRPWHDLISCIPGPVRGRPCVETGGKIMGLLKITLPLCLLLLILAGQGQAQAPGYLGKLSIPFPTDGTQVRTSAPLAPYVTYRIKITALSNLKHIYQEYPEGYNSFVVVDGQLIKAVIFDQESDGFVGNLEFLYRGNGKMISIGLSEDKRDLLSDAQLEIFVESWIQRLWREQFRHIWTEYGMALVVAALVMPVLLLLLFLYLKRTDRMRADEERAEAARRTFLLESHNKRIEVMREIDVRAHQRAQEMIKQNYDELQKKIIYWRTRAYTESYFLNVDLRHQYAHANREKVINQLEKEWAQECQEIAQDLPLMKAMREQEPGIIHWIQARQEVVYLAHNLAWKEHKVIDAYFEEIPETEIIIADELDFEEVQPRVRFGSSR